MNRRHFFAAVVGCAAASPMGIPNPDDIVVSEALRIYPWNSGRATVVVQVDSQKIAEYIIPGIVKNLRRYQPKVTHV